jgi:hypothetical protein
MWAWSDVGKGLDYILEMSNLSLSQISKLKGWINHWIKGPESIADHMYSVSLMALIADDCFSSLWKAELRKVKQFISWEDLCFSFFVCTFKNVNVCIYTLASCNSNLKTEGQNRPIYKWFNYINVMINWKQMVWYHAKIQGKIIGL